MKVARNEPCPCGSGRKYKDCCLERDRRARRTKAPGSGVPPGVELPHQWAVNLSPFPAGITSNAKARLAIVLVEAGGYVVHQDLVDGPPTDADGVAGLLAAAIAAAAAEMNVWPTTVTVRHAALVAPLLARLADHGVTVTASAVLPGLDRALVSLHEHLNRSPIVHVPAMPETWAGWGLPEALVADLFRAAAAYYRAAPWRWVANVQVIAAAMPNGRSWTLCLLGNAGQEFGLALYGAASDMQRLIGAREMDAYLVVDGPVLSVTFDPRRDQPPAMQREVAARGWEVAGRDAWPLLMAQNTLGAGVSEEDVHDLIACLLAVPPFVEAHRAVLTGASPPKGPLVAVDSATGVRLTYSGMMSPPGPAHWPPPAVLAPCTPEGAGADPEAAVARPQSETLPEEAEALLARFAQWLPASRQAQGGQAQGGQARGGQARGGQDAMDAAEHFALSFLAHYQGLPTRAVTEMDLRLFLFEWYPRKVRQEWRHAKRIPSNLGLFFEFLARSEAIDCPWAAGVLAEEEAYTDRWESCPGHFWWDEGMAEWRAEVWDDLDRRLMLHDGDLGADDAWGSELGMDEALLENLLGRQWLLWRDEVVRAGTTDPTTVRLDLTRRQRQWERQPRPEHGGRSAIRVIKDERKAMARRRK